MRSIELLKDFRHEGKAFKAGAVININQDAFAQGLIDDGTGKQWVDSIEPDVPEKSMKELVAEAADRILAQTAVPVESDPRKHAMNIGRDAERKAVARSTKSHGKNWSELHGDVEASDIWGGDTDSYLRDVIALGKGVTTPRMAKASSEHSLADGAAVVPQHVSAFFYNQAVQASPFLSKASIYSMDSNELVVPKFDFEQDRSTAGVSGVVAAWSDENSSLGEDAPELSCTKLTAHKLSCFCKCSNELLADSPDFASVLGNNFSTAQRHYIDASLIGGTGSGQPQGLLNASCKLTVSEAGEDNLLAAMQAMVEKLPAQSLDSNRCVWLISQGRLAEVLNLQQLIRNDADSDSVGGTAMFSSLSQSTAANRLSLYGAEIFFVEHLPNTGAGSVVLADLSQFAVGIRSQQGLESSARGAGFESDQTYFRMLSRIAGSSLWSTSLTLADGVSTVSPIVAIA